MSAVRRNRACPRIHPIRVVRLKQPQNLTSNNQSKRPKRRMPCLQSGYRPAPDDRAEKQSSEMDHRQRAYSRKTQPSLPGIRSSRSALLELRCRKPLLPAGHGAITMTTKRPNVSTRNMTLDSTSATTQTAPRTSHPPERSTADHPPRTSAAPTDPHPSRRQIPTPSSDRSRCP